MPITIHRSVRALLVVVTCSALAVTGVATLPATAVEPTTITIDDPAASGPVRAGEVTLTGSLRGLGETTTVLYAVDATDSTAQPNGQDCDGGLGPSDDLNGDGSIGDTLDCEIGAVRALDALLASAGAGRQVGLVAFANEARAADLSPDGSATFVPPGYTGGDAVPRVVAAAASVKRHRIELFDPVSLADPQTGDGSGDGTAFDDAVATALATLGQAPAGPKWVLFLSDGAAPLHPPTEVALQNAAQNSGVRLRSFAIGSSAHCEAFGGLAKMAEATGETCVKVANAESLRDSVLGSFPEATVAVSVGGTTFAAPLDPVGGWRVTLRIGKGTYTARATATMPSGATLTTERTITVTDAAPGSLAPPAGSVAGSTGTLLATQVDVRRPGPSRAALPKRVTGKVGTPGPTPKAVKRLNGATVLLQGRSGAASPWVTVGRSTVSSGDFTLRWKRRGSIHSLRVELQPYGKMAASSARVQVARISSCRKADGAGGRWTLTCHTTAKKGTKARLLEGNRLVDRSRVTKAGVVGVTGTGRIGRHVLVVDVSPRTHHRLSL